MTSAADGPEDDPEDRPDDGAEVGVADGSPDGGPTGPAPGAHLAADDRPVDPTPVHTADLPPTPQRDRRIPATAWFEAPPELLALGADIGQPLVAYKRRIGRWLLWRAGPARRGDARYMALAHDDLADRWTFRLFPDGRGEGTGPDGSLHHRFRTWKEALRDAG